jgi:hypothetical protein
VQQEREEAYERALELRRQELQALKLQQQQQQQAAEQAASDAGAARSSTLQSEEGEDEEEEEDDDDESQQTQSSDGKDHPGTPDQQDDQPATPSAQAAAAVAAAGGVDGGLEATAGGSSSGGSGGSNSPVPAAPLTLQLEQPAEAVLNSGMAGAAGGSNSLGLGPAQHHQQRQHQQQQHQLPESAFASLSGLDLATSLSLGAPSGSLFADQPSGGSLFGSPAMSGCSSLLLGTASPHAGALGNFDSLSSSMAGSPFPQAMLSGKQPAHKHCLTMLCC